VFEEELKSLCGEAYKRSNESDHYRSGSAPSYVMTQDGRERMSRPRVRKTNPDGSSEEMSLTSWKLAQSGLRGNNWRFWKKGWADLNDVCSSDLRPRQAA
ncbi:hypothetical protein RZS08_22435, partial [Arthrospira platensis SPKY1]|nr:hypothetical protein [Arthrospira platensis SPKY1]